MWFHNMHMHSAIVVKQRNASTYLYAKCYAYHIGIASHSHARVKRPMASNRTRKSPHQLLALEKLLTF